MEVIADLPGPRDYVALPDFHAEWKVADVGPGAYPLGRADLYIDRSESILSGLPSDKNTLLASLESGLPQIPDKSFDFVWCSHVLEHVEDPLACAATLSRIGKSGVVVMPSFVKESLFNFEEVEHKWIVLPHPREGENVIMVRHNPAFIQQIKDPGVQVIAVQMFRAEPDHETFWEHAWAKEWFKAHELDLDVVIRWTGSFSVTVIQ